MNVYINDFWLCDKIVDIMSSKINLNKFNIENVNLDHINNNKTNILFVMYTLY